MPSETTTSILIEGNNFFRVTTLKQDLGHQTDHLTNFAKKCPITIPYAFILRDQAVGIQVADGYVVAWHRINEVTFSTVATIQHGITYPLFKLKPAKDTVEFTDTFTWSPKGAGMELILVHVFLPNAGYTWKHTYLLCRKVGEPQVVRPPMPNIYGDGRVCMGGTFQLRDVTLMGAIAATWHHFDSSTWNADAIGGLTIEQIKNLYSFKDGKQVPPADEWKSICAPISVSFYNNLPL